MAPNSIRSTFRKTLTLCVPSIAALIVGVAIGVFVDAGNFLDSVTSVALVLPVTLVSHTLTLWLRQRSAAGAFFGLLAGVIVRALVIVGGGAVLYLLTDLYVPRGVALWVWVIGVYLSTLAVELSSLTTQRQRNGSPR